MSSPEETAASEQPNADPTTASVLAHGAALHGLQNRPLAEHAEHYQQVHAGLQAALADIDGN